MADYNEAIKNLQTIQGMPLTIRLAIEALEKQIQKKPLRGEYEYECRSCKCGLEFEDFYDKPKEVVKYCVNCGQALDWGDE